MNETDLTDTTTSDDSALLEVLDGGGAGVGEPDVESPASGISVVDIPGYGEITTERIAQLHEQSSQAEKLAAEVEQLRSELSLLQSGNAQNPRGQAQDAGSFFDPIDQDQLVYESDQYLASVIQADREKVTGVLSELVDLIERMNGELEPVKQGYQSQSQQAKELAEVKAFAGDPSITAEDIAKAKKATGLDDGRLAVAKYRLAKPATLPKPATAGGDSAPGLKSPNDPTYSAEDAVLRFFGS